MRLWLAKDLGTSASEEVQVSARRPVAITEDEYLHIVLDDGREFDIYQWDAAGIVIVHAAAHLPIIIPVGRNIYVTSCGRDLERLTIDRDGLKVEPTP